MPHTLLTLKIFLPVASKSYIYYALTNPYLLPLLLDFKL